MMLGRFIHSGIVIVFASLLLACGQQRDPEMTWQHSEIGSYAAAFSPNRRYVLVGDTDRPAKLWDLKTNKVVYAWQNLPQETGTTTSVAFSRDGKIAATVESDTIVLWLTVDGQPFVRLQFPVRIKDIAISPNGDHVFLALQDRTAVYFDVQANRVVQIFKHDGKAVNSPIDQLINAIAISPDGRYGLTGGDDNTARLWNLKTGQQLRQWQLGNDVGLVAFEPRGRYVVTAADNDQTRMWDIRSGKQIAVLNTSPVDVDGMWGSLPVFKTTTTSVGFSRDGNYIVTGHPNRRICVWQAKGGKNISCWQASQRDALKPGVVLQALTFSADGKFIYSESGNGLGQKWRFK